MKLITTPRGFTVLEHDTYDNEPKPARLIQASSAIRHYENAADLPGSSCLWIGADHRLDREEVAEFIGHLQRWLDTGSLDLTTEA